MDLNERKKLILQAIIDEYIGSAEPVGSRAVSKKHELGLSSATIRNEMADLEEMGYLIQPYTSAGRIPSDAGYRFYVNSLMKRYKLELETVERLQSELAGRINRLDIAIKQAGLAASALTDYATVVASPVNERPEIKKIDLVPIDENVVTLIIVTSKVSTRVIRARLGFDECQRFAAFLNEHLRGKSVDDITFETISELQNAAVGTVRIEPQLMINVLHYVYESLTELNDTDIYVQNVRSILKYPEYSDVNKAQSLFAFLEDKQNLKKLISSSDNGTDEISARIGSENDPEIMKDCSLVTVNYKLDGSAVGRLGVIGPKRMNYAKVFASLDLISHEMDKLIGYFTNGL